MTHRPCAALITLVAALASAGPAHAAAPSWTTPQDLGAIGGETISNTALATNDRRDAVAVLSTAGAIFAARATAGRPFSTPRPISSSGFRPKVAIDSRGVALIAFSYDDGTRVTSDLRDDDCCTGVRVSVWQPGRSPTPSRAVTRRGTSTQLGAVAATRGHRGVLIAGEEFTDSAEDPARLVPVRIDGRLGATRRVAGSDWSPLTLQWTRERAIAGLVRISKGRGTELAVARQGRSLRFAAPRNFVRLTGQLSLSYYNSSLSELTMSPDGRGGQIAAYQRGKRPQLRLAITRKSLNGRARSSFVQRGPDRALKVTPPARARDGWIAVAWARRGGPPAYAEHAYVTTRSPAGRLRTTALPTAVNYFSTLAVGVAPGGAGAVGVGGSVPRLGAQARVVALAGGRPQQAIGFGVGPTRLTGGSIVIGSNARERARAVFEFAGRAFATRLEGGG